MRALRVFLLLWLVLGNISMLKAQPAPTWQTGQISSYMSGDDGDLERGVDWPSPRFQDNGDGTITDNLTGLIWLQNANCAGSMTWESAVNYCNNLSSGSCGLSDGSAAGDWRLPNRKELMSLIDYSHVSPALQAGHPFSNVQSSYYWSSTTSAYGTSYAWRVYLGSGLVYPYHKSRDHYVWPVRAGQFGSLGHLIISIEPMSARDAGAQWRVDGGVWHNSGGRQSGLSGGEHTVEFKNIDSWSRPGNMQVQIIEGQTTQGSGTYSPVDANKGLLEGVVVEIDSQGEEIRPLPDAEVSLGGYGTDTTDTNGEYLFSNLTPDDYAVTVSRPGYYSVSRDVTIAGGETQTEVFRLTEQVATDAPVSTDFKSPDGKHFIPGMPDDIRFTTMIAWNGDPGSVRFLVAGEWHEATISNLGGGMAQASLTLSLPEIDTCSELVIEVTNGEDKVTMINAGVRFSPITGVIPWYSDNITWTPSGTSLFFSEGVSKDFDLPIPGDDIELSASFGYNWEIAYDLLSATFSGSLEGEGGLGFKIPTPQPGLKILGSAGMGIGGALDISFAGCDGTTVTPSWSLSFNGKAGIEAPVVLAVDAIAPGVGSTLASIPLIGDLKLQLFQKAGGALSGVYEDGQTGDCFLGSTDLNGSVSGGPEASLLMEMEWIKAKAGVYIGGTGTFGFGLCPEFAFDSFTGRLSARSSAELYGLTYEKEIGAEIEWDFTGGKAVAKVLSFKELGEAPKSVTWQPIGKKPLQWGDVNRLASDQATIMELKSGGEESESSAEENILENVIWQANPTLFDDASESVILYTHHDTEKPWYAATDVGSVYREGENDWASDLLTDDLSAEFNAEIAVAGNDKLIAAWTRVEGDISEAESPEEIAPHLEIVAAWYDRTAGTWSTPEQLTANSAVDRDPLPVVYGGNAAMLWVQNQGEAMLGGTEEGDSLLTRNWNGSAWDAAATLWSGQKGVVRFGFTADDQGEGHVVFSVDEDGDPETTEDRDLYWISTDSGAWQTPVRLTDDTIEDALPTLISPAGNAMLVWRAGDTLKYTLLSTWNPQDVYTEYTAANEAPTLDGVTMSGGATVAYTVQSADGVDIMAAFYDAALDQWSLPRQLTHDMDAESSLSLAFDGSELIMAYLKTQTLREDIEVELDGELQTIQDVPQPGQTDLYVLNHALGHDLAVAAGSLTLDPSNPAPNTACDIQAVVENQGDLPAENVVVAFYDGNPDSGGTEIARETITGPLVAGSSQEVTTTWDVPDDPNSHIIYIIVDPDLSFEDRDRGNNTASSWSVLPDIKVVSNRHDRLSATSVALTAAVSNNGAIPTGTFDVCWNIDAPNGQEIGCESVESIEPGKTRESTLIWDTSANTSFDGKLNVYTSADADNGVSETDTSNNTGMQIVGDIPLADSDNDGIPDVDEDVNRNGEVDAGETDPHNIDTDGDGVQDGTELGYTLLDIVLDTDIAIFIPDADAGATTTDPLDPDSDGDGFTDGEEDRNLNGRVDAGEGDPNDEFSQPVRALPWLPILLE